jgi:hypothetical protein
VVVVDVDVLMLADEEAVVVVVVELTAVELTRSVVVELAAEVEEEAMAASVAADFDVVVVKRQIPRAALPPHICNQSSRHGQEE